MKGNFSMQRSHFIRTEFQIGMSLKGEGGDRGGRLNFRLDFGMDRAAIRRKRKVIWTPKCSRRIDAVVLARKIKMRESSLYLQQAQPCWIEAGFRYHSIDCHQAVKRNYPGSGDLRISAYGPKTSHNVSSRGRLAQSRTRAHPVAAGNAKKLNKDLANILPDSLIENLVCLDSQIG